MTYYCLLLHGKGEVACAVQIRFDPSGLQYKTMKSMDNAARLAMMPDYEMYCVDLSEGNGVFKYIMHINGIIRYNM